MADTLAGNAADIAGLTTTALRAAREHPHGRYAEIVVHDGVLRQMLLALVADAALGEHNSPHAASLYVLRGRIRVTTGSEGHAELEAGQLWTLTHERHGVSALEDSVFLLTTVTGGPSHP